MPGDDRPSVTYFACDRTSSKPKCEEQGCTCVAVTKCAYPLRGRLAGKSCGRWLCASHRVTQAVSGEDLCPGHDYRKRLETKARAGGAP